MRRLVFALLILLGYAIGYVAFTWPLITTFTTRYLHEGGDGWVNVWNVWWVQKALLELHSNPWWTDWLFHPDGITLIGQSLTPINGLMAIPLTPFLGPVATYNTLTVFGFAGGGYFTYLLARHLTGHVAASLFAGAVVTFSHYHFAHAVGHLPQVTLQFVPLFLLAWLRMLETPSVARGLWAGGALTLVLLSDLYFVLYCVIFAIVLFGHEAVRRRSPWFFWQRDSRRALLTFTIVALATVGVFTASFLIQNARDPLEHAHDPYEFSSDLLDAFVPGISWRFADWTQWHWQRHQPWALEFDTYLCFSVLALAGAGVRLGRGRPGRRVWLILAALGFVISLGPGLSVAGHAWRDVPMPYRLLELVFPPLRLAGSPSRTGIVTTIALAMLAAYGIAAMSPRARRWSWLLVLVFCFEVWPHPIETSPRVEPDDVIEKLATLPDGAVFEPGEPGNRFDAIQQARQMLHGRKLPIAYVSRASHSRAVRFGLFEKLLDSDRHAELMRTWQVRYLVLPNGVISAALTRELVPIHAGPLATIFVLPEDELASTRVAPLVAALPEPAPPGSLELVLNLHAPRVAGQRFICAFSSARTPYIFLPELGVVPLAASDLLTASLTPGDPRFAESQGRFDAAGRARVRLQLPPDSPHRGQALFYAVVVTDESATKPRMIGGFGSWTVP